MLVDPDIPRPALGHLIHTPSHKVCISTLRARKLEEEKNEKHGTPKTVVFNLFISWHTQTND